MATAGCAHAPPRGVAASSSLGSDGSSIAPISAVAVVAGQDGAAELVVVRPGVPGSLALGVRSERSTNEDLVHRGDPPWISADGGTLVYFVAGRPHARTLATGADRVLVADGGLDRAAYFTAGSRDGRRTLVYRFTSYAEEEDGVFVEGVFELVSEGAAAVPARGLRENDQPIGLTDDGHVVVVTDAEPSVPTGGAVVAIDPRTAERRIVLVPDEGGFVGQPVLSAGFLAWSSQGAIRSVRLDDALHVTDARVAVPAGGFAEYQWPTVSPSGARVAYEHELRAETRPDPIASRIEIVPREGGEPSVLYVCRSLCRPTFESEDALLVEEDGGLTRVPLVGEPERLVDAALTIAVRGR